MHLLLRCRYKKRGSASWVVLICFLLNRIWVQPNCIISDHVAKCYPRQLTPCPKLHFKPDPSQDQSPRTRCLTCFSCMWQRLILRCPCDWNHPSSFAISWLSCVNTTALHKTLTWYFKFLANQSQCEKFRFVTLHLTLMCFGFPSILHSPSLNLLWISKLGSIAKLYLFSWPSLGTRLRAQWQ